MSEVVVPFPAANENMSMKAHAERYKSLGLSPHGMALKSKAPNVAWQTGDWSHTVEDGKNIGCRLDDLVDIDVDYHPGGPFMTVLAPSTFMFGRESAKFTHYLYRVEEGATSKVYSVTDAFAKKYKLEKPDGKPKKTILEIRTGSGFQTVFPPSTHESGEAIRFETHGGRTFNGDPTAISFKELKRCAAIGAMACVFEIMWKDAGSRHDAALNAAGVLRRYFNATEREAMNLLLNGIIRCDGDEEPKDRERAIRDAYKVDIKKAAGWAGIKKTFGLDDADIKRFASWAKPDAPDYTDDLARMNDEYKIVTHAGATKIWASRMNFNSRRLEWVPLTETALALENHQAPYVKQFLRDLTKPIYKHGFYFDPTTTLSKDGGINKWRGWAIEPKEGPWPTIERHMREVLCEGVEEYYNYVLRWCAFFVQYPDRQAEVALVFRGIKGSGKGQFIRALYDLAPQHSQHITDASQLVGRFNDHFHDCVFVYADEAFWAGTKEGEGNLKRMITEPTLSIEGKGDKLVTTRNMLHLVISSNEDWTVPATPGERRFAAFQVSPKYAKDAVYMTPLAAAFAGDEMRGFFHTLKTIDLDGWHPRQDVPETDVLAEQKIHTGAYSPEGVVRNWLDRGYLPGTHAAFGQANAVAFDHAMLAANGKFTATKMGTCLAKYAAWGRTRRKLRSETGEISDRQIVAYTFPALAEARMAFDDKAKWNEAGDWVHEFSEGAPPPKNVDQPELVLVRPEDDPPF